MAKAIARTIDAYAPKSTQGPMIFRSATAHDNVVEIQYAIKDAVLFARYKTTFESTRIQFTRYYCSGGRLSYVNGGVVLHQIMTAPNESDRIEITIDRTSCADLANLPAPKTVDAESLARMTQAIAARENAEQSAPTTKGPFRIDVVSVHDNVVELHWIVADASVGSNLKNNSQQMRGYLDGYFCNKYGNELGQGISIHQTFTFVDGGPVADFTINRSSCGF